MAKRFLKLREVCERYGVGPTFIYTQIKAGKFVEPDRIGDNCSRWSESKLDAFDANLPSGVATERAGPGRRKATDKASEGST